MKVEYKIFKGNKLVGTSYFIEKYENQFEVIAELHKKQGLTIERI